MKIKSGLALRIARPSDRARVISLIDRVASERRYLQTLCYQPTPEWEQLLNVGKDSEAGICLLVLTNNEKIIGMGRLFAERRSLSHGHTGSIGLALAPGWRNRRWGTVLLRYLIDCARQFGYADLQAEILQNNKRSLKLFQNFGFVATQFNKIYWSARQAWVNEVTVKSRMTCERMLLNQHGGVHGTFSNSPTIY